MDNFKDTETQSLEITAERSLGSDIDKPEYDRFFVLEEFEREWGSYRRKEKMATRATLAGDFDHTSTSALNITPDAAASSPEVRGRKWKCFQPLKSIWPDLVIPISACKDCFDRKSYASPALAIEHLKSVHFAVDNAGRRQGGVVYMNWIQEANETSKTAALVERVNAERLNVEGLEGRTIGPTAPPDADEDLVEFGHRLIEESLNETDDLSVWKYQGHNLQSKMNTR